MISNIQGSVDELGKHTTLADLKYLKDEVDKLKSQMVNLNLLVDMLSSIKTGAMTK